MTPGVRGMLGYLAWAMEDRGRDSWGATNGQEIIKHLGPITESWELPDWNQGIFHTRSRSVGAISLPNAHPFTFEGEHQVIGIHNGCISNWVELNRRHGRDLDVDSMHIFANLAEGKSTEEIEGWGALAYYFDGVLKLCRFNTEALVVARLEEGPLVFASTKEAIVRAAHMAGVKLEGIFKPLDTEHVYDFVKAKGKWYLVKGAEQKFGFRYVKPTRQTIPWEDAYSEWGGYAGSRGASWNGGSTSTAATGIEKYCFKCARVEIDRKRQLLCPTCLREVVEALDGRAA